MISTVTLVFQKKGRLSRNKCLRLYYVSSITSSNVIDNVKDYTIYRTLYPFELNKYTEMLIELNLTFSNLQRADARKYQLNLDEKCVKYLIIQKKIVASCCGSKYDRKSLAWPPKISMWKTSWVASGTSTFLKLRVPYATSVWTPPRITFNVNTKKGWNLRPGLPPLFRLLESRAGFLLGHQVQHLI